MAGVNSPAGYSADSNFPIYNHGSKYPIFGGQIRISGVPTASDYYAQLVLPEPIWPYKMTYRPNSSGAGSPNDLVIKWQASNDG